MPDTNSRPHRMLFMVSGERGFMEGADINALQVALKGLHPELAGLRVDGEFGPATASAVAWAKRWVLGFPMKALTKGYATNLSVSSQEMVRGMRPVPRYWLWRAGWRMRQLAKRQAGSSMADRAAAWAESQIGLKEQPAGTNKVPPLMADATGQGVMKWIAAMGFPWCAFGFWLAYLHAGSETARRVMIKYAWNGLYTPTILDMALAGQEGLRVVGWSEITRGTGILINFPGGDPRVDHIEMSSAAPRGDELRSIGFNTSFEGQSGSQSNGGAVAARTRYRSQVRAAFVVHNAAA